MTRSRFAELCTVGLPVVCLLWAGITIGVSFIATPAKFLAPSLTLPAALDVGRHTFAIAHLAQLVIAPLAIVLALGARRVLPIVAVAALLVQHVVLLPILDARAGAILVGAPMQSSSPHGAYVALELVKVVALVWGGIAGILRSRR